MLEARSLHKSFGALAVTRNVSFSVPAGARYAIVGPNGSGKTTLFNLLTGETQADGGQVLLDGTDISNLSPDARARNGLTRSFQKNNLFPDLTAGENLALAVAIRQGAGRLFWRRFAKLPGLKEAVETIAERLGLADVLDRPSGTLPYGTQRQLELGLALAVLPKVLLLDEPTAGMSPEETRAMTSLIAALPRETTLVIIEHDMAVLFEIAERMIVLDYGSILVEGTPQEVRASEVVRRRYFGERTH
jgi:branched-chain amino acid transport system ATP-binding protein